MWAQVDTKPMAWPPTLNRQGKTAPSTMSMVHTPIAPKLDWGKEEEEAAARQSNLAKYPNSNAIFLNCKDLHHMYTFCPAATSGNRGQERKHAATHTHTPGRLA